MQHRVILIRHGLKRFNTVNGNRVHATAKGDLGADVYEFQYRKR